MYNRYRQLFWITLLFIIVLVCAILLITSDAQGLASNVPNGHYMLVYEGSQGLRFFCIEDFPFELDTEQTEAEIETLVRRLGYQTLYAQGFEVMSCNMDNFYYDENDQAYVWRFGDDDDIHGISEHRHMYNGAYWINWLRLDGVHTGQ